MYFRTKSIKGSQLVQLVQSYRNSDGLPRQRVIVSLGDAKLPEAGKSLIASALERRESRGLHYTLDYPHTSAQALDTILVP